MITANLTICIHDKILIFYVIDLTLNQIKNKKLYLVGKCCAENGVPDNCLGRCVEEPTAILTYQSPVLPNVCERYRDIIDHCTAGKFHMQKSQT